MQIQWFPGHMHKAQKEIKAILSGIDIIIELLDARIPFSSQNPMLQQLRGNKPRVRLMHKADLADEQLTRTWQSYLQEDEKTQVRATSSSDTYWVQQIPQLCRELSPSRHETRPIHALIVGIPNVGKSTVINLLAGRNVARTGDEPAVTRAQQRVKIGNGVVLCDTPGVLWPNLENRNSGFRLAVTGAIRNTALDSAEVATFAAQFLSENYPDRIQQRYTLDPPYPDNGAQLLERIGRVRGALSRGSVVDLDRAGKLLLTDIRSAKLGRLTFETPDVMQVEQQQLEQLREQRAAEKERRRELRRKKFLDKKRR